jgi:hypothetical protein
MGIPSLIKCFFVVECVIFGPFALHHYLACANTKQLEHLSGNRVAWLVLHSGEMLHGVGALLVLFVVLNALITNAVSTVELEIILLAHSLWLGTIIAFWPLAKDAAVLHIPLWCGAVWKSKFYGAFVLNHRVVLHAIDATPARWRGDAGSSPLGRARTDASLPRNDLVKNCRVHPAHWLISTQVRRRRRLLFVC